ncbi:hypothetical protein [Azoarcus sp. DD4]|uniref:hypothetical protein n=1 Tax=Azoarcus sp. DD4 TaxID=2027405 RepID=UPI001129915E|nr:hypothetical protein [Azoarcus sp. DD4]
MKTIRLAGTMFKASALFGGPQTDNNPKTPLEQLHAGMPSGQLPQAEEWIAAGELLAEVVQAAAERAGECEQ